MADARLERTLTLWPAVGLAVTMVVGSGVLVLPGLAYHDRGAAAVWSWVSAAVVCVPLLRVIAVLGARYPSAGGIAGFVRPSLGQRVGDVCEVLLLAAIPGGAGLALVAGHLVADLARASWMVEPFAVVFLSAATVTALRGASFVGDVVRVLAAGFVIVLFAVAVGGLATGEDGLGVGSLSGVGHGAAGIGGVFFAFVGWELMTFLGEEFVDPERDFPRMIAASFAVVVGLYVLLSLAVQMVLDPRDEHVTTSPVAAVAAHVFGPWGRIVVTVVGLVIVTANINGVVLAFSRLVIEAARSGRLPRALGGSDGRRAPGRAVVATAATFALLLVPVRLGVVSQSLLFELAGSVFFAGFLVAAIAFTVEADTWSASAFGVATCGVAVVALSSFGWVVLYPVVIVAAGFAVTGRACGAPSLSS